MKISIIRGGFLNPFELQNYYSIAKKNQLKCISSKFPISDHINLPLVKLWSPTDLPLSYKYQILNRVLLDAHYLFGLEKVIKESDIVHVAETYYHYALQAIQAKKKGLVKKIISTVWETIPFNNETLSGRKMIKQIARKEIDHFIAVTEIAKKALIKEGIEPNKITIIPMGVDVFRFKPTKTKRKSVSHILYIGRLVKEKGVEELLESFKEIKKEFKNMRLTIIGNGPLKNKCQKAGAILKAVPYSKIHREYQKADLFILPSQPTKTWEEQFGMVLVEALSCGLPIITSDTPVLNEVCRNSALYIQPGNVDNLTAQIKKIITDNNLRKKLQTAARRLAYHHYDSRKIAGQILKVYEK